jgi:uncharacterized membrane protein YecN with MAPEG domain
MAMTTAAFAGLFLLLQLVLSAATSVLRGQTGIGFGDGGDPRMTGRMRAHGNFIENVPIILIAMALAEIGGSPVWFILAAGWLLFIARLIHAASMYGFGDKVTRGLGSGLTLLILFALGVHLLVTAGGHLF